MPFLPIRIAEITAAVVSAGAPTDITDTSANVPWSSDKSGNGFYLIDQNVTRTSAQVQAGTAVAVTSSGAQTPITVTGLSPETTYYAHFVVVIGGVSSAVSTSALTTAAVPIIGDTLYGQTFLLMDFDDLEDRSPLAATFTANSGASVSGGELVLDGVNDSIISDARINDYLNFTGGSPWTLEWTTTRPPNANNILINTNDGATSNRGIFIDERADGSLRVNISKAVNGQPIMDYTFPAGTVPAGEADKVLECNFGPHDTEIGVIHFGANGNRIASGDKSAVNNASVGAALQTLEIGRVGSNVFPYSSNIKRIRGTQSLRYNLKDNATYTGYDDAYLTIQQPGFQTFTPRHFPSNDIDDGIAGLGYKAEPDITPLSTDGHALCFMHCGPSHQLNTTTVIGVMETADFGVSWSAITEFQSDASVSVRGPVAMTDSNGRIWVGYNYTGGDNVNTGAGLRYSDDDGSTWSTEVDMSTVFSAGFLASNWRLWGVEETSQGIMWVAYNASGDCEIVHCNMTGTPTFGSPITVYTGQTGLNEPTPVRCHTTGHIIIVPRDDNSGNRSRFHSWKSSDGGLTWASSGSANWRAASSDSATPVGMKYLDTGDVMIAWTWRNINALEKRCYYTITDAATLFATPTDGWDHTGPATQVEYHKCWGLAARSEYGYQGIWDLGGGDVMAFHNEGVDVSTTFTRIYAAPLQV